MGLFKCSKCECIDNTALGMYWISDEPELFQWPTEDEQYKGKPLCCECAPKFLSDGNLSGYGQWHYRFPKEHISTIPEIELKEIYNK